jgi:hypothetical protein
VKTRVLLQTVLPLVLAGFLAVAVQAQQTAGTPGSPSDTTTILKENGYATSWFGKNHNTAFYQASQAGPFDQWPTGMGFDYFYGFVGGDTSQWQPNLLCNTTAIYPFQGNPGWNLTTAMADEAIQYMKQLKEIAPDKPFFVYYVPGGTHAPHHPTKEWIKKISDMHLFDEGWNKIRETIFANQKRLGIMPADAKLTPWPKELPEWDSLSGDEKKLFLKQADVFGAYLAYTDHEIGRVIQAVEDLGELDNTLIIYIAGDNGASSEGMLNGTPNEFTTFNGVAVPAACAPDILAKDFTIKAEVEIPEGGAEGMIVTEGGRFGGYGLFLSKGEFGIRRGKPVFLYNLLDLKRTIWDGPELSPGKHTIVFEFKYNGPGFGKGATGVLSVDGHEVAKNSLENTTPIMFPEDETLDVGADTRTGVAMIEFRYDVPFQFTGKISKLTFELGPAQYTEEERKQMPAIADRVARARD